MRRPAQHGAARRRRRQPEDDGFALITTVLAMAVLAAFSLVVLQQTITNTAASRKDQDWVAALAAAQAGLDDYVSRLNDTNGGYYTFTTASPDAGNPAMGSTALGTPKWAPVPLAVAGDAARGEFHYDVDNTGYTGTATSPPNGNLVVESTGRVGKRTRTLRRPSAAPASSTTCTSPTSRPPTRSTYGSRAAVDAATTSCSKYYLPSRSGPPTCQDIAFTNDRFTGPVHSNDAMLICDGNQFLDAVTTGSPKVTSSPDRYFRLDAKNSTGAPIACGNAGTTTYQRAGDPAPVERINIPSTNLALKRETDATAVPRGCLFVGPTKITIMGSPAEGEEPLDQVAHPGLPRERDALRHPCQRRRVRRRRPGLQQRRPERAAREQGLRRRRRTSATRRPSQGSPRPTGPTPARRVTSSSSRPAGRRTRSTAA